MTRPTRQAVTLVTLLCVANLLTGCFRLPHGTPVPRRWVLAPTSEAPQLARFTHSLGVGPVELPGYLDRSEIVERLSPHEVRANSFDVWAEPLSVGTQRVLSEEIRRRVPGLAIVDFPWKGPADLDHRLTVVISRFEHDVPSGAVVLEASWALRSIASGELIAVRSQSFHEAVVKSGFDEVTASMSRAVAAFANEVAADLLAATTEDAEGA